MMTYVETITRTYDIPDIDIDGYIDWLEGSDPNVDNLIDYIFFMGLDYYTYYEDAPDGTGTLYDCGEFLNKVEDELNSRN